ncbi:MAG: hypothetical protein GY941_27925 [Planctomycetes bacterium]|nr:hypothetical protein [Planctomycetota bacterium]
MKKEIRQIMLDNEIRQIMVDNNCSKVKAINIYNREVDKVYKERKTASGRGITDEMYDYLLKNPTCTKDEFKKWIEENGTANTMRSFNQYDKVRQLANRVYMETTEDDDS